MANEENIKKHRFKKGQSGNPKGRPPVLPELKAAIANLLSQEKDGSTLLDGVLSALARKALKGDVRAAQELLDRGFGKSTQIIDAKMNSIIEYRNVSKQFPDEE